MTIVDLGCHPKNFFDDLQEIVDLCKESELPELRMAGIMMHKEIEKLEDFMMAHRVEMGAA